MKRNPFPVDNGSTVDEPKAPESPTSREETSGTRAGSPWTHRGPRNSRNSPRRPGDHIGTFGTGPESLKTPPRSPGAPSGNSDADVNDSRDEVLLRSPGEYGPNHDTLVREIAQLHLDEIEEKTLIELNQLTERTGMPITQENGQRRYGPPLDCELTVPPRGSEVFVGKLPRNCYEPELVPVFEKAGKIYELRLMMDFSGTNRGYCFVHYFEPEEADRAVRELNNYEIRRGRRIGVVKSVDNCRLFVGGIPKDKNAEEIQNEMDKLTDGVVDVLVYPTSTRETSNPGYAFIEYESHKAAAMARRKLMPGKLKMWGLDIAVDWAEPKDNDTDDKKDVPENQCDQNARADQSQPPKAAPPRDRNRRFKNGPHSRPATHNNGQSIMAELSGYQRPGNPVQQTPNVTVSFQQQAVFNQGFFPNYGAPQPTTNQQQYQPVSFAQVNAPPNPAMYGISPPLNQSIPIPINRAVFPKSAIPGVPDEVYLGQWHMRQGQGQQQPFFSKFPLLENQWVGLGMNQNQGMNC